MEISHHCASPCLIVSSHTAATGTIYQNAGKYDLGNIMASKRRARIKPALARQL